MNVKALALLAHLVERPNIAPTMTIHFPTGKPTYMNASGSGALAS